VAAGRVIQHGGPHLSCRPKCKRYAALCSSGPGDITLEIHSRLHSPRLTYLYSACCGARGTAPFAFGPPLRVSIMTVSQPYELGRCYAEVIIIVWARPSALYLFIYYLYFVFDKIRYTRLGWPSECKKRFDKANVYLVQYHRGPLFCEMQITVSKTALRCVRLGLLAAIFRGLKTETFKVRLIVSSCQFFHTSGCNELKLF
jgi:hypothetical protein